MLIGDTYTYKLSRLQQKVTDMDTHMGALAQMVAYPQRKRGKAEKKTDKDKPNSQTFINWSQVRNHNGNNTRREVRMLRGGYLVCRR